MHSGLPSRHLAGEGAEGTEAEEHSHAVLFQSKTAHAIRCETLQVSAEWGAHSTAASWRCRTWQRTSFLGRTDSNHPKAM